MTDKKLYLRWKTKKQTSTGPTRAVISKSDKEGWLKVVAPYNANFVDDLKSTIQPGHRSWDPDAKAWGVNEVYLEDLVAMCQRHFNDVETDLAESKSDSGESGNGQKYRMVCLITITNPAIYSPESFEQEIEMFNKANDGIKVEVQTIKEE